MGMASGKTHDGFTWAMAPAIWMIGQSGLHYSVQVCLLITVGTLVGGLLLSPDLDTKSRPFYRWGIFRFIWLPYQWMAKHRSKLSHGLLLASWFRLLYLYAILTLLYSLIYLTLAQWIHIPPHAPGQDVLQFTKTHLSSIAWLGIGIWIGALLHILLDYFSSAWFSGRKRQ